MPVVFPTSSVTPISQPTELRLPQFLRGQSKSPTMADLLFSDCARNGQGLGSAQPRALSELSYYSIQCSKLINRVWLLSSQLRLNHYFLSLSVCFLVYDIDDPPPPRFKTYRRYKGTWSVPVACSHCLLLPTVSWSHGIHREWSHGTSTVRKSHAQLTVSFSFSP